MTEPILALDRERVAKLTGIPKSTLTHWENQGVFRASYAATDPYSPSPRNYSFRDIVTLRTLAMLRRDARVSFQETLETSRYLSKYQDHPWSELRLGFLAGSLVFWEPEENRWSQSTDQQVLELNIAGIPEEIRKALPEALKRDPSTYGVITRNRHVLRNQPIIAGTRILTSSIWSFHQAGYTNEEIIEEYPHLTPRDIQAAVDYERDQREAA